MLFRYEIKNVLVTMAAFYADIFITSALDHPAGMHLQPASLRFLWLYFVRLSGRRPSDSRVGGFVSAYPQRRSSHES
jgi:hypothetical protein